MFSRGRDLLGLRRYALHLGTMKMLTILKASYSDEVFRKALAEVSDEAIEGDNSEAKDVKRIINQKKSALHSSNVCFVWK